MTPIHEIAFLVLSGSLACWTAPPENPCAAGETIRIAAYEKPDLNAKSVQIDRRSFHSYVEEEVGNEESGPAIFKIENLDWYQIKDLKGQAFWVHLPTLQKQFQFGWNLKKIENILGHRMARVTDDYTKYMRKDDLRTPMQMPQDVFEKMQERHVRSVLKEIDGQMPTAYVEVRVTCTSVESTPGAKTGSCAPPPNVNAYEKPDLKAAKMPISMSWANWAGKPAGETAEGRSAEELYIFKQLKDWVAIQVAFGPLDKRTRWINKNDIPNFKILPLTAQNRVSALADTLKATGRQEDAQKVLEVRPEPGFQTTGRTKWSPDGVLWAEVEVQDTDSCSGEEPKTLMKVWLPYKFSVNSPPIVGWYSRGC